MARHAKPKRRTPAEIESEIAGEVTQHEMLQRDLREALVEGEDSSPYRRAIAETQAKIADLRAALGDLKDAEQARRKALTAGTALEMVRASQIRHAEMMNQLEPPPFPEI